MDGNPPYLHNNTYLPIHTAFLNIFIIFHTSWQNNVLLNVTFIGTGRRWFTKPYVRPMCAAM